MAVITIRHEFATGGRELGRRITDKVNYRFVDKCLFQKIADNLSVSNGALESFEKSRHYYITNLFLRLIPRAYISRIVGHDKSVLCEVEYQNALKQLIREVADRDNVLILGRAACYFLKDRPDCYRVRISAPMEWRERYAVEKLKIPANKVKKTIAERDANQNWFNKAIYKDDYNERFLYHVTINMENDIFDRAAQIVCAAAGLLHHDLSGNLTGWINN